MSIMQMMPILLAAFFVQANSVKLGSWRSSTSSPVAFGVEPPRDDLMQVDDEDDLVSFIGAFSELHRRDSKPAPTLMGKTSDGMPFAPEASMSGFEGALQLSKLAVNTNDFFSWVPDSVGTGAIPQMMHRAEELLALSLLETPADLRSERAVEQALRLYHHAKWLAERNLQQAAEWRFREAAEIAQESRRTVLASHSLSRLGYFLMFWNRPDEAREVLLECEILDHPSNHLGRYLYGLLEREAAAANADPKRLHAAEDRILRGGNLPSEELEDERSILQQEIQFWRSAESSPWQCLAAGDVAHTLVCLFGHAVYGTG
mmetsp:Transcript_42285/g.92117  ORF Transcript_42285/g.92117 Transcript_42285/m.92117 type:complete len:317 (+) Transcript_42285:117-1067(+)